MPVAPVSPAERLPRMLLRDRPANPGTKVPEAPATEARAHLIRLLSATGDEDQEAFRDLYNRTATKLFGICLRVCGDRHVAEDVLHDVYITIWKRAGAYQPALGSPISWLAAIARNRAIDWRRRQRLHGTLPMTEAPDLPDPAPNAETLMLANDKYRHLHLCLAELDSRHSSAIRRAFFDGHTYAELAENEGVPLGTMKSWVRRGLNQIRTRLDETC